MEAHLSSVHADLTAVFASMSPDQAPPLAGKGAGPPRDRARSGRLRTFGVAAVLLMIAAGLTILAWSRRSSPTIAVAPARVMPAPTVTPEAPPSIPAPVASVAPNVVPSEVDVAAPPPVPSPVEPAATEPKARPTAKAVAADHGRKLAVAEHKRGKASAKRAGEPREDHPEGVATAACPAGYEAWCLREVTAAADRDLRNAYAVAVHAKVAGSTLRHVRRDWVRYRRLANKRPRDLLRGYAELTVDLRRSASQKMRDDGHERPR